MTADGKPTYEREEYDEHVKNHLPIAEGGVVKDDGTIVGYREWLTLDDDLMKVIDLADVVVTDYTDGGVIGNEYAEARWTVEIGGKKYIYERWASHSGGGSDWRDAEDDRPLYAGAPGLWYVLDASDYPQIINDGDANSEATLDGLIDSIADLASAKYATLYNERVQSVITQIKQEAFPFTLTK